MEEYYSYSLPGILWGTSNTMKTSNLTRPDEWGAGKELGHSQATELRGGGHNGPGTEKILAQSHWHACGTTWEGPALSPTSAHTVPQHAWPQKEPGSLFMLCQSFKLFHSTCTRKMERTRPFCWSLQGPPPSVRARVGCTIPCQTELPTAPLSSFFPLPLMEVHLYPRQDPGEAPPGVKG